MHYCQQYKYLQKKQYKFQQMVGEGNESYVVQATHNHHQKPYAIKIFKHNYKNSIDLESYFYQLLKGNPRFPQLLNQFYLNNKWHFVFEYIDYDYEIAKDHYQNYFREMALCIQELNKYGIIHRDIKPQNFLYSHRTSKGVLIDFGRAELDIKFLQKIRNQQNISSQIFNNLIPTEKLHKCISQLANRILSQTSVAEIEQLTEELEIYQKHSTIYDKIISLQNKNKNPELVSRIGTKQFMPIECFFDHLGYQTPKIDVWSFGVTLFYNFYEIYEYVKLNQMMVRIKMSMIKMARMKLIKTQLAIMFNRETIVNYLKTNYDYQLVFYENTMLENVRSVLLEELENKDLKDLIENTLVLEEQNRLDIEAVLDHQYFK